MKYIEVQDCSHCPHFETLGGFGQIAYIPYCKKMQKRLPYTEHADRGRIFARVKPGIPKQCPLPDLKEQ